MADTEPPMPPNVERRKPTELPLSVEVPARQRVKTSSRRLPLLKLGGFYMITIGIAVALVHFFPLVRHAWVSSPIVEGGAAFPKLPSKNVLALEIQDRDTLERTVSVLLITLGALALSLPVAWVYTFTRRLRYDIALVHSVIILPMVVSGIVVIVKDSVALAFSLAGIVAAVRFRNTLKDPKDAVYIFLSLGIGLAAGVQALDIALVMSFVFNCVVLVLWKYNLGAMYGEAHNDILAIGDRTLMIARSGAQRDALRWRLSRDEPDMKTDGVLLIHTDDPESARQRMELTLSKYAKDWRVKTDFRGRRGMRTFAVLLRMKDKKADPLNILGDIDERWAQEISAAEYVPYRRSPEADDD